MTVKSRHNWVDHNGEESVTTLFYPDSATATGVDGDAVRDAMQDCSDAELYKVAHTDTYNIAAPGTPSTGPYATEAECLTLEFQSVTTRKPVKIDIPAPDDTLLAADDESITPGDADSDGIPDAIDAYITALVTNLTDAHGGALVFKRAYRGKMRPRKD